jgi:hypothetical protein
MVIINLEILISKFIINYNALLIYRKLPGQHEPVSFLLLHRLRL